MFLTRREMMLQGAAFAALAFDPSKFSGGGAAAGRLPAGSPQKLSGEEAIRRYLALRAAELEREFLPGITTAADFENVRPSLRDNLFDMLGLHPMPERTAVDGGLVESFAPRSICGLAGNSPCGLRARFG
jgi:hypothetical protein